MKMQLTGGFILAAWFSYAQPQHNLDSLQPAVQLNEAVVVEQSPQQAELGFYQSTQQNGVEAVLERMTGISMIRRGNYAPDIVVHGMRNGQVATTINGMQIFGACTDRMDPITSYVEANNLKSISTGKGNQGCHSANIAGGLDLKLNETNFGSGWHGLMGGGYGTNAGGYNGVLNTSYSGERLAANVNAVYRKQGNYTDGNGHEVLYTQYEKINLAANLRYRTGHNQVARFDFILDDAFNMGYAALPMDVAFAKARIFGLTYSWFPSGFFKEINAKGYYNFIDHAMDDSHRPDVLIRMDMPGKSETYGGYLEGFSKTFGNHQFYAKAEAFSNFRHAEMTMYPPNETEPPMYMLTWPDVRKTSALLVLNDEWTLGSKSALKLEAKMQMDFNDIVTEEGRKFMTPFGYTGAAQYVLPAFNANYRFQINRSNAVSASAGLASRGPTTSEQYGFYLFNAYDGYDYIGKPDIRQEDAVKFNLGYNWQKQSWSVKGNAYYYHINNYILGITDSTYDAMTIGANGVRVYANVPWANLYGIDLAINGKLTSWFSVLANLSYTRGKLSDGKNIPLIPPLNGVLSFKFQVDKWQIMFENEMAISQDQINPNFGDQPTDGYWVNNLKVLKSFKLNKTTLNAELGIDNILDSAYRIHLDWGGILRPGRNVYVQLNYGF